MQARQHRVNKKPDLGVNKCLLLGKYRRKVDSKKIISDLAKRGQKKNYTFYLDVDDMEKLEMIVEAENKKIDVENKKSDKGSKRKKINQSELVAKLIGDFVKGF